MSPPPPNPGMSGLGVRRLDLRPPQPPSGAAGLAWAAHYLRFRPVWSLEHLSSPMSQSVWAYITNHGRLGSLCNRNLFLIVLEARKSKNKILADLGPGEKPLPGL